jgi:hypothetical protein
VHRTDLARLRDIAANLASPSAAPTASPGPVRDPSRKTAAATATDQARLPLPEVISDRSRDHGGAMMCGAAGSPPSDSLGK